MPTEIRQLIFTGEELTEAIATLCAEVPGYLPPGEILLCQIVEGAGLQVNVKVLPHDSEDVQTVPLDAAFVGACLVKFCLDRKIPLPTDSVRHLQLVRGNIALNLSLSAQPAAVASLV